MMVLLKDAEVSRRLGVSRRQVWKLLKSGVLPRPVKIGGSVRWVERHITWWIEEGCPAGWTAPGVGKAVCA
jgi:predicted DNA-binding transcriptional regulator AlpA